MKTSISLFLKNTSGATAIEYGVIAALISVAIIGGVVALGDGLGASSNSTSKKVVEAID